MFMSYDKWTNAKILEFLDHYKEEPILWNASHPQYKARNEVYEAWRRIEANLNNEFSVNELKKKKESIMASFRACLSKVRASIRSSSGTENIYKPIWFAYDKMYSFLIAKNGLEEINFQDITSQLDDESQNEIIDTEVNGRDDVLRKKIKCSEPDDMKQKLDSAFSILQAKMNIPAKTRDLSDAFGELVALRLKRMNDRNRAIAIHKIENLLFDMEMNTYTDDRLEPSTSSSTNAIADTKPYHYESESSAPSPTFSQQSPIHKVITIEPSTYVYCTSQNNTTSDCK